MKSAKHVHLPAVRSAKTAHAQAVIAADAVMSARREPLRRISYSRRNGWWTESSRYRGREFTYGAVVSAVDALLAAGILVDHDLQPGGRATGIQSSYRPPPCLAGTSAPKLRRASGELIRLKNSAGALVGNRDTERTHRERMLKEAAARPNREMAGASPISGYPPLAVHNRPGWSKAWRRHRRGSI